MSAEVIDFLRATERRCHEQWLASPPEHTTLLALKWAASLRRLDDELQARARLALTGWRP